MGKKMGKLIGGQIMKNPRAVSGSLVNEMVGMNKVPSVAGVPSVPSIETPMAKPKMMPKLSRGKNMFKKVPKI